MDTQQEPKQKRGFAAMSQEARRAAQSKGGRAGHASGKAHTFDSDEAKRAGRRGGTRISEDREHMANIGRRGAEKRWGKPSETEEVCR